MKFLFLLILLPLLAVAQFHPPLTLNDNETWPAAIFFTKTLNPVTGIPFRVIQYGGDLPHDSIAVLMFPDKGALTKANVHWVIQSKYGAEGTTTVVLGEDAQPKLDYGVFTSEWSTSNMAVMVDSLTTQARSRCIQSRIEAQSRLALYARWGKALKVVGLWNKL
jgi:hypothetical protein